MPVKTLVLKFNTRTSDTILGNEITQALEELEITSDDLIDIKLSTTTDYTTVMIIYKRWSEK